MGSTISISPGAFGRDRQILDAALITNEVVEESRKHNAAGSVFKIDFEKAYDRVEWQFVDEVMVRKGFGGRWRSWIPGCLYLANFSIMINGRPIGKFKASRGLRQGDPLSPFLFTLVIDVLSRLLEKAQEMDVFHGLVAGRDQVEVSHLQFTDDTIFLFGDRPDYWHNLLVVLDLFCFVSGMRINKSKCSLIGINYNKGELATMAEAWGCEVGAWSVLYLDLHLGGNPRTLFLGSGCGEGREKAAEVEEDMFIQRWKTHFDSGCFEEYSYLLHVSFQNAEPCGELCGEANERFLVGRY